MSNPPQFDVFLCHNTKEKAEVLRIREQLQQRGIRAWIDKYDLEPFRPWQDQLAEIIPQIKAAAIFIGASGIGPWADIEMREFLVEFVNKKIRLGLVLLPGCPQNLDNLHPPVPRFLQGFHWIDFRESDPDPMDQLMWGITGQKPQSAKPLSTNAFTIAASTNLATPTENPAQLTASDWFDRGLYKQKQGDNQGAVEDYTKAIQLKPDYAITYKNRGISRYILEDNQGAIEDYNKSIQIKPNFTKAYTARGISRYILGDIKVQLRIVQKRCNSTQILPKRIISEGLSTKP